MAGHGTILTLHCIFQPDLCELQNYKLTVNCQKSYINLYHEQGIQLKLTLNRYEKSAAYCSGDFTGPSKCSLYWKYFKLFRHINKVFWEKVTILTSSRVSYLYGRASKNHKFL